MLPPDSKSFDPPSLTRDIDLNCPLCRRVRPLSASDPPTRPRTIYTGARLVAANRALTATALAHVASEPYGLGSPCFDDDGKEVARFRSLRTTISTTIITGSSPSPSPSTSSSSSPSSSPPLSPLNDDLSVPPESFPTNAAALSRAGNLVEPVEFRARFRLVQVPRPGMWKYHVTDDWSNAEAMIRATPKLRRIIAGAISRLFSRRSSSSSYGDSGTLCTDNNVLGINDGFKKSRQLPFPVSG